MKKTLLALALMGAMAGTASADQVTMYGSIDLGLDFTSIAGDHNPALQEVSDSTLKMGSGQNSGNRFGLKGTEELGNGVTVGFVLENGFNGDDGTMKYDRLFGREAQLYVQSQYGTLAFGRMSMLSLDAGSYGIGGNLSAFGTGWGSYIGNQNLVFATQAGGGRSDNMITYKSPTMYGVTVYGQYSFGVDTDEKGFAEGKTEATRYGSLGATYEYGGFGLTGIFEYTDKANNENNLYHGKDTMAFTLGASYDCGYAKTYIAGQYFKDASWVGGDTTRTGLGHNLIMRDDDNVEHGRAGDIDGYGIVVSTSVPVFGGDAMASVGYMDADSDESNKEVTRWMVGAGYQYPLSKRTLIYGGAGYVQDKVDNTSPSLVEVVAGMKHTF